MPPQKSDASEHFQGDNSSGSQNLIQVTGNRTYSRRENP